MLKLKISMKCDSMGLLQKKKSKCSYLFPKEEGDRSLKKKEEIVLKYKI